MLLKLQALPFLSAVADLLTQIVTPFLLHRSMLAPARSITAMLSPSVCIYGTPALLISSHTAGVYGRISTTTPGINPPRWLFYLRWHIFLDKYTVRHRGMEELQDADRN
ncbi:hypothetical protein [Caballeronia mineralivorans]|uniref:hypothetical protein n=1 Tax=Caballeronia mineralivorans TaxID=2010198 RepID=UPI0023F43411|nr:hypothetical protein [Caballeronia mineralivorans]